jgi:YHS domain-containing protein
MNSYPSAPFNPTPLIMKHIATLLLAISLLAGFSRAAEPLNTVCPISGKPANPAITSTYSKTVALCCNKCKAQFNANPKGYLSNIIAAVSGQCPLSKKRSDPSITVSYSRQVAFADAASKTTFDAAPDKHIKEVRQ